MIQRLFAQRHNSKQSQLARLFSLESFLSDLRHLSKSQRKQKFQAIQSLQSRYISDPAAGLTQPNPWRILNSDGFQVMQIDTRPGLCRQHLLDDSLNSASDAQRDSR